ncbi:MAG TPA: class I SAM-dependent methyltransferase [Steroidobacteraceae bacterium]|nr:class I SAM-dependent methyltransferase [Steroidobacteraceae bacterium]
MQRIPEPELMDEFDQARAYAAADFSEPNERFAELFLATFPQFDRGAILDLGCGPGDIALRLAARLPRVQVHGLDGSQAMLDCARERLSRSPALAPRVQFLRGLLPGCEVPLPAYDAVVSNSLLHHLHDPQVLWHSIRAMGRAGAPVLVMDLFRPPSLQAALDIVATYAAGEPEVLRRDFHNSLLAAFEPGEVRAQLDAGGLGELEVRTVSDRHLLVVGHLPG